MSSIFISHAVADKKLAGLLVTFLQEAIGVPFSEIFCSSLADNGVPFGEDFNAYIKAQIEKPKLTLLLLTPSYLESAFCMMELGAVWSRDHSALAIVVPPIGFEMVSKTLGLKQAWNITDKSGLINLRSMVTSVVQLEPRGEHAWDDKRSAWKSDLNSVLKTLSPASKVAAAKHQEALNRVDELEEEISDLETQLEKQRALAEELASAKDRSEVLKIKAAHAGISAAQDQFDELIDAIRGAQPEGVANVVLRHLILDHYDKAGQIDWFHDRESFEGAIQRNLLDSDDGHSVKWGTKKLRPLGKALDELDVFLTSDEGEALLATWDDHIPTEADDIDFWTHHLNM